MLKRVDRVQIATRDRTEAERTVADILGGEVLGRDTGGPLAAGRTTMQAGTSLIEILEPVDRGPVADFIGRWGGGLFSAGFSVENLDDAVEHLARQGVVFTRANGQLFIDPDQTCGLRAVISVHHERAPIGAIRWLFEVTNVVRDWRAAADRYSRIFALDRKRFVPLTIDDFGYTGALTMFDAPGRLDRIELSQITRPEAAMGRFFAKRGESLYMFYCETEDVEGIIRRLEARKGRFVPRHDIAGLAGLFIHPTAFCGTLVGVSRTDFAWNWSGDPERSKRSAERLAASRAAG
jgi:hypothetical protein